MDLLRLHQQLVQGEDTTEALARLLLPRLRHQMAAAFPTADPAWVSDAVTDTLLEFFARPDKYDPRRGKPLIAFLAQAAAWKLRDLARSHRRQERYQEQTAELCQEAGPGPDSPPTPPADNAAGPAEPPPEITAWLVGQMEDLKDRKLIRLMMLGVRKTAAYAKVMGCSGTTVEIQRREVKRAKERLSYKLRCLADRWVTEHPQALRLNCEGVVKGSVLTIDNEAAKGLTWTVSVKPYAQTAAHRVCRSPLPPDEPGGPPGADLPR